MDDLAAIRIALAIAEEASFARAARRLKISPTAASRAIAAIEGELGTTLFRRTTRSVALTEAGANFLAKAGRAVDELDAAARAAQGLGAEPRGTLVITAPLIFGRLHVLPVVTGLLERHPALNIRLMLTDRLVHLVEEGVDVAVRIAPLPDSALLAVRLTSIRRIVIASPKYLERFGVPQTLEELSQHQLIAFENDAIPQEWRFAEGRSVRLLPRLRLDSADAVIEAATRGAGIARVLDYQASEAIERGRLIEILAPFAPSPLPVSLVFDARQRDEVNLRAFVEAARRGIEAQVESSTRTRTITT